MRHTPWLRVVIPAAPGAVALKFRHALPGRLDPRRPLGPGVD